MMTLEEIRMWCGTPTELDGLPLSPRQANFLAQSVSRIMHEAEHPFEQAVKLGCAAFRRSFEPVAGGWNSKKWIGLGHHSGKRLRNRIDDTASREEVLRESARIPD